MEARLVCEGPDLVNFSARHLTSYGPTMHGALHIPALRYPEETKTVSCQSVRVAEAQKAPHHTNNNGTTDRP